MKCSLTYFNYREMNYLLLQDKKKCTLPKKTAVRLIITGTDTGQTEQGKCSNHNDTYLPA